MGTFTINNDGVPISTALGYDLSGSAAACADIATPLTMYLKYDETWSTSTVLYSDTSATLATAGYYSDGVTWKYWDGSSFTSNGLCP